MHMAKWMNHKEVPYLIQELVDLDLNILKLVYRGEKLYNYILDFVYELNSFCVCFHFFI
jgi:hypothetical protein